MFIGIVRHNTSAFGPNLPDFYAVMPDNETPLTVMAKDSESADRLVMTIKIVFEVGSFPLSSVL
jgi:hypothetical protein